MLTAETLPAEGARYAAGLVCIPGLWAGSRVWRGFASYLGHRGWECHLLDVRGVVGGLTARAAAVREYAAALPAPAVFVGHDAGGLVALAAAARGTAAAVVLLAPLAPGSRSSRPTPRRWRTASRATTSSWPLVPETAAGDVLEQRLEVERLHQRRRHAEARHLPLHVAAAGEDDHRDGRQRGILQLTKPKLEAVHGGQHQVQQDETRPPGRSQPAEPFLPVGRGRDLVAFPAQQLAQGGARIRVVLDDQHGCAPVRARHAPVSRQDLRSTILETGGPAEETCVSVRRPLGRCAHVPSGRRSGQGPSQASREPARSRITPWWASARDHP